MQAMTPQKSPIAFFAFFIGLTILVLYMMTPFIGTIVFSMTMALVLKPLYDRLLKALKGRSGWAVAVTLLITILVPMVLIWFAGSIVIRQVEKASNSAAASEAAPAPSADATTTGSTNLTPDQQAQLQALATKLGGLLEKMATSTGKDPAQLKQEITQEMAELASDTLKTLANLGMTLFNLFLMTVIFMMIVAPMLLNFDAFVNWIEQISPFPVEITQIFFTKVRLMTLAMFASIFIIAALQGLVMGFFFWLAGAPALPLWTFLSMLAAMMPFGASIIAIPVGIFMILGGNTTGGLIVILGYVLIVSNIDTFLRPALVPKGAALTYALTLLATLGGLYVFGFLGVIYGPVIMVLFVTVLQVYQQYYGPRATKQAADTHLSPAE